MDPQSSTRTAQSSIRSFFQPLLQQQQQHRQQEPQFAQTTHPMPTKTNPLPQHNILSSPPPPVKLPSSYALPPGSNSPSQEQPYQPPPPPRQTTTSNPNLNIPPQSSIHPISKDDITPLRRINALLLPITYPDSFYHAILLPSPPTAINFSRIITWEGRVIGGVVCRLDRSLPSLPFPTATSPPPLPLANGEEQEYDIYIQSLCLLSPYRSKGLVAATLNEIIISAIEETCKGVRIKGLYAHVWTGNEEALEWYMKRGFNIYENGIVQGYYRRLKPDTAYILRRELTTSDHLAAGSVIPAKTRETNQQQQEEVLISAPRTPTIPPPPTNTPSSISLAPSPIPTPIPNSPRNPKLRPPPMPHARSFQDRGPEREWNDLPEDVLSAGSLTVPGSSNASSRSSSRSGLGDGTGTVGRGKKKRVYPAAAFGS